MNKKPISPMTSCREAVRTAASYPLSAHDHLVKPIALGQYGYTEKEYIIKGNANVYEWEEGEEHPHVRTENAPYCSRMLVRMPENPGKFSGTVIVELLNYASGYDRSIPGWAQCYDYYLKHNIAWIGLTIHCRTHAFLKEFDPERYVEVDFPNPLPEEERKEADTSYGPSDKNKENGLRWDMISQVADLLKSEREENPMKDYEIKEVIATAASGGDLSMYVAGFHPLYCTQKNEELFDGFLIYMTGAPGCINQTDTKNNERDLRNVFYANVPFIFVYTSGDMLSDGWHPDYALMQRRPDADQEDMKLFRYEIAGAGVRSAYDKLSSCSKEDVERTSFRWRGTVNYEYDFPVRYILKAAHDALIKWIRNGITPPHSPLLETEGVYPANTFILDEAGNTKGGIRLPYVDAPLYNFQMEGGGKRLSADTIRKLYSSKEEYLLKVINSVNKAMADRFLLPDDAAEILNEAVHEELPELDGKVGS